MEDIPEPCARERADDLAALAIGSLTGRERVELLGHLEGCSQCQAILEGLVAAADALPLALHSAEPPPGFSRRVVEAMGRSRRVGARRTRVLIAALVLAIAGLGTGLGLGISGSPPASGDSGVVSVALRPVGASTVMAYVSTVSPSWIVMAVSGLRGADWVQCAVTLGDGRTATVGSFYLSGGSGSWSARLPAPLSSLRRLLLLGPSGATLASARL